ncbi:type II toxin-antitoxin system PemK/MazF family toxin [Candidatus Poribacteria bacterium]|nr:type II toxin-antitoxin system PemK/MazF family toxin [Candidatus Poribacteria bacterium]
MLARDFRVIHRGEVYWLNYQFAHEAATGIPAKARPVLVISAERENSNRRYPTVVIASISALKPGTKRYVTDLWVTAAEPGLSEDSRILLGQIQTHLKDDLGDYLLTLPSSIMGQVDAVLASNMGII